MKVESKVEEVKVEARLSPWKFLSKLLPTDLLQCLKGSDVCWKVPPWAFLPDVWTFVLIRGLQRLKVHPGQRIWEVGVGSGLVSYFLQILFPGNEKIFSDYDDRAAPLAVKNLVQRMVLSSSFSPLYGSWDLFYRHGQKTPSANVVVACVPQIPLVEGQVFQAGDNKSHYYCIDDYPESQLHHLGLGLTDALLRRAKTCGVVVKGDRVILNLAARPGLQNLFLMFKEAGYTAHVLYNEIVEQHAGTKLDFFLRMESSGQAQFTFYSDPQGRHRITATEAESLRISGKPIFHTLYVIEGTVM